MSIGGGEGRRGGGSIHSSTRQKTHPTTTGSLPMTPNKEYRPPRITARCIFLTVTLAITAMASGLMTLALMTDYWEYVDFDHSEVNELAGNDTTVEWLLNNTVARLSSPTTDKSALTSTTSRPTLPDAAGRSGGKFAFVNRNNHSESSSSNRAKRDVKTFYLVPMYGGVWATCTNLKDSQRKALSQLGYTHAWCKQYLSPEAVTNQNDWMTRMQNLSISCAMVCLILLATSALVGLFGLLKRQISAVLVTGVMYILAAVFCIFTLSIMHFKRKTSKNCGLVDPLIPKEYQHAQVISVGWSLAIGWVSVCFCLLTAFFWYFLSKIMRYGPFTMT